MTEVDPPGRRNTVGLDYAWNRYYSATWGRFTSADPYVMSGGLQNPQGWNRYSYVSGDPVNYHDPSGLFQIVPPLPPDAPQDLSSPVYPVAPASPDVPVPVQQHPEFVPTPQGSGGLLDSAAKASALLYRAADLLRDAFREKPDCAGLFNLSGMGPAGLLDGMLGSRFGSIGFQDLRGTDWAGTHGYALARSDSLSESPGLVGYVKVDIMINARDDFSRGVYWNGNLNGDIGRARILLHELGHVANLLLGGGGSLFKDTDSPPNPNWQHDQSYNQALERKCFP